MTDTPAARNEALEAFDRRIDTIRYILNIANETPRAQIGGLLLRFHKMDDGSIKSINQELEEFWQSRETIRRALTGPRCPEGWKMVPIEPTEEMAGAVPETAQDDPMLADKETYRAMVNAAPPPPDMEE